MSLRLEIHPAVFLCIAAGICTAGERVAVIAHRGNHVQFPENTLAAFQAAIDVGADYFETDVRTTKDGRLVLLHDSRVDTKTNGTGEVASLTFDELRRLEVTGGGRIPTLDEALRLAKGRIGVYVDVKRAVASDVVDALERHGMLQHVVIFAGPALLKEIAVLSPHAQVMPEAVSVPVLTGILGDLQPRFVAFDARDFKNDLIVLARKRGARIYVDRLGPDDQAEAWNDAVARGASGIQTDRPKELIDFLRSRGLR